MAGPVAAGSRLPLPRGKDDLSSLVRLGPVPSPEIQWNECRALSSSLRLRPLSEEAMWTGRARDPRLRTGRLGGRMKLISRADPVPQACLAGTKRRNHRDARSSKITRGNFGGRSRLAVRGVEGLPAQPLLSSNVRGFGVCASASGRHHFCSLRSRSGHAEPTVSGSGLV